MKYKIISVDNTKKLHGEYYLPDRFNNHIDQIAKEVPHNYKPGKWKNSIPLIVEYDIDKPDKPSKILWFHKDDLELISN